MGYQQHLARLGVASFVLAAQLVTALPASAQPYRVVAVAPLPGQTRTELTDLNDSLQGVGFSGPFPIVTDGNGTRPLTGYDLDGTPPRINNAGVIVATGRKRSIGGISFRNELVAIVEGRAIWLNSPSGESSVIQVTDSEIVLISVRQQGTWMLRGGQLQPVPPLQLILDGVTSFTESGTGVFTRYVSGSFPTITRATYAWLPDGREVQLWPNGMLGTVLVGPTGHVVQSRIVSANVQDFFVASPDGRFSIADVPPGHEVSVRRPNAVGDVVGTLRSYDPEVANIIKPFLYRNGQFTDLNEASGLPPGSIRGVRKITNAGAIVVFIEAPGTYFLTTDLVLIPIAPRAPAGVSSSVAQGVVTVQWERSLGSTDYIVEAGSAPGATNYFNGSIGSGNAISAAVPPGRYFVRVRARNAVGVSGPSSEVVIDVP